jgi:predicted unusual protein kinase regulating ubiquinone biosynthesis (AarF/ABC1/UbiB family)
MPWKQVRKVLDEEWEEPCEELFEQFDHEAAAAASIGQVHRAVLPDGRKVAVKIQYPGVAEAIAADMQNAGLILRMAKALAPGLDAKAAAAELKERVLEELDYELEAQNQRSFARGYRGHPFIHVPDVVPELSTARVLTSDLAEGVRFDEMATWSQDERNMAAEAIYRFVFRSLYRLHAFNGDPHPGNYLFRPGGKVTFLDFGLVKYFTPTEVEAFEKLIQAYVIDRDVPAYRTLIEDIGLLKPGAAFTDAEVEEYYWHFYSFVMEDKEMTVTPEWSSQTVQRFFDPNGPYGEIAKSANLPASFVIIQRINLGLMAILGDLAATANFRLIAEELWPFIDRAPTTEMGEAEAAWLAEGPRSAR